MRANTTVNALVTGKITPTGKTFAASRTGKCLGQARTTCWTSTIVYALLLMLLLLLDRLH